MDISIEMKDVNKIKMVGGDMNAHIWELYKCENMNGKLLMIIVNEMNLQIMIYVWERMMGLYGSQRIVDCICGLYLCL